MDILRPRVKPGQRGPLLGVETFSGMSLRAPAAVRSNARIRPA